MKEIKLTNGKVALVDSGDHASLVSFSWSAGGTDGLWYAFRTICEGGKRRTIRMHQQILSGLGRIDHRDGDGLNNQRNNLRAATHAQNMQNRRMKAGKSSGYKGVYLRRTGRFQAYIQDTCLGTFSTASEAAQAYDVAARSRFGDFARLNFS